VIIGKPLEWFKNHPSGVVFLGDWQNTEMGLPMLYLPVVVHPRAIGSI